MSSPIVKVVWKDEGDFGFITTITQADIDDVNSRSSTLRPLNERAARTIGIPYDPNRVQMYGTREEAKALAREHNAEYQES